MKQAYRALFVDGISDWSQAEFFPKDLREKLSENFSLKIDGKVFFSSDKNTLKALVTYEDGESIETVLMRHEDNRNTVCVSSQVGCPMGCAFCATGTMGFKRNLSSDEIVMQVLFFQRYLKKFGAKVSNIVFMGMGEPMRNYDEVLSAVRIFNDKDKFNIAIRRISISTCGVVEGINKLAEEGLQVNLAISLHAPNDALRDKLMPINKLYPLDKVLKAVNDYMIKTGRKVMFEYLMIQNVNDSKEYANELINVLKKNLSGVFMVNLIPYNETGMFQASDSKAINSFKKILEDSGIEATQRFRFGRDVDAACGQLKIKNKS